MEDIGYCSELRIFQWKLVRNESLAYGTDIAARKNLKTWANNLEVCGFENHNLPISWYQWLGCSGAVIWATQTLGKLRSSFWGGLARRRPTKSVVGANFLSGSLEIGLWSMKWAKVEVLFAADKKAARQRPKSAGYFENHLVILIEILQMNYEVRSMGFSFGIILFITSTTCALTAEKTASR